MLTKIRRGVRVPLLGVLCLGSFPASGCGAPDSDSVADSTTSELRSPGYRHHLAEDICRGYLCTTGEHCAVLRTKATCVPDSQNACARVRCPSDHPHCVEWAKTGENACLVPDQCHRDADCQGTQRCQPQAVCVRAPCFMPLVCRQ